jgi:uncharacterized membrane protein
MSPTENIEKSPSEYGREALTQWRDAARFGAKALAERKKEKAATGGVKAAAGGLKEHLPGLGSSDPEPESGVAAELGELADAALSKLGKGGKLAAKVGVGSRIVKRLAPAGSDEGDDRGDADADDDEESPAGDSESSSDAEDDAHLFDDSAPLPIQESIDVAVPVAAVFDLCTRFEELPRFSGRIREVEIEGDDRVSLRLKVAGHEQDLVLEIVGEEPEERIDWEGTEGLEHAGVVSFHPLAPRLTRIELTIERDSESIRERVLQAVGLPQRAIRHELRRFKAYAELWDEANDYRSTDFKELASEESDEDEPSEDESPEEMEATEGQAEEEELEAAA